MDQQTFLNLLAEEVKSYRSYLETSSGDWIVKGFIDINKNVYTITNDTKVVSKIIEILLIPRLNQFAINNGMILELPSAQNYYPDLTFIDSDGKYFAVDFKSSYYEDDNHVNGLTLGSYWGYFRNREKRMSMDHPYCEYKGHFVLGMLYKQSVIAADAKNVFTVDELSKIHSVIEKFIFFVQPKWKVAIDRPGSGNTRNIGGVSDITKLVEGYGPFTKFKNGEKVFDHYWSNYYNKDDAKKAGFGMPHYNNISTYISYLREESSLLCDNIENEDIEFSEE